MLFRSTLAGPPGSNCCHNVRLIGEPGDNTTLYPVPYDFDASGFINARYASPAQQYPIKKTTQRYYSGWCKEERFVRSAIDVFIDKKPDIYATILDSGLLREKTLKSKTQFIDKFYDIIENEQKVQTQVLDRCRGNLVKAPA